MELDFTGTEFQTSQQRNAYNLLLSKEMHMILESLTVLNKKKSMYLFIFLISFPRWKNRVYVTFTIYFDNICNSIANTSTKLNFDEKLKTAGINAVPQRRKWKMIFVKSVHLKIQLFQKKDCFSFDNPYPLPLSPFSLKIFQTFFFWYKQDMYLID